jgi:hypothetical protein
VFIAFKYAKENIHWLTGRLHGQPTVMAIYSTFQNNMALQTAATKDLGKLGKSSLRVGACLQLTPTISLQGSTRNPSKCSFAI